MTMFNIDDRVWLATFNRKPKCVSCPDCGGTKTLRVTLFDGQSFDIACQGCARGYEPPSGQVQLIEWAASAERKTIVGVQVRKDQPPSYHFDGGQFDDRGYTFATEAEAIAKAEELRQEHEDDENRRILAKTKDHRSWAWHVHYHRNCAKSHREKAEYHERMCAYAKTKTSEAA
jgi:hypothetical protein